MSIQSLRTQRAGVVKDLKCMLDTGASEGKQWTAENQQVYDSKMAQIDAIDRQIDFQNKLINQAENSPSQDKSSVSGLFAKGQSVKFKGAENVSAIDPETCIGSLMHGMIDRNYRVDGIQNALSEGTDSAGGFSTPEILTGQFIDVMRNKSVCFRAGAQTLAMESDNSRMVRIATDPVPAWRVESAAVAISDPTFEAVVFAPKSLAVIVKVSRELLMDSVNIDQMLQASLAGAVAVELDRVALNGTGVSPQPTGVTVAAGVNSVSMGTNGLVPVNYSQVLSALQTLEESNSGNPTAMIMAPRSYYRYQGLLDSTNQPLQPPESIKGIPMLRTQSMPITLTQGTSNDCSNIVVGNFVEMVFGVRSQMRIEVLNQTYAGTQEIGFICWLRADVKLLHEKSFCKITGVR